MCGTGLMPLETGGEADRAGSVRRRFTRSSTTIPAEMAPCRRFVWTLATTTIERHVSKPNNPDSDVDGAWDP